MTRIGFFLFNIMLVTFLYGLVYLNGSKPATISYVLKNFSIPYGIALLLMTLISSIRWFMSHDPEVGSEIVTWVNGLWFIPAITVLALWLVGGLEVAHIFQGLRTLMASR